MVVVFQNKKKECRNETFLPASSKVIKILVALHLNQWGPLHQRFWSDRIKTNTPFISTVYIYIYIYNIYNIYIHIYI